jgi:hypothetical protein
MTIAIKPPNTPNPFLITLAVAILLINRKK